MRARTAWAWSLKQSICLCALQAAVCGGGPDANVQPHPEGHRVRGHAPDSEQDSRTPHTQVVQTRAGREARLPARWPPGRPSAQVRVTACSNYYYSTIQKKHFSFLMSTTMAR